MNVRVIDNVERSGFYLDISIQSQRLLLFEKDKIAAEYPVSTAKNGPGQKRGSECTPLGWHVVRAKIGDGCPINTVFVGRRPTGEVYNQELAQQHPGRDWILTRILWLGGLEPGKNRYGEVDTCWRYIYIHGAPDHSVNGVPASHGCIRMKNKDILQLFEAVKPGAQVFIHQ